MGDGIGKRKAEMKKGRKKERKNRTEGARKEKNICKF
jgi:hypothetical protein